MSRETARTQLGTAMYDYLMEASAAFAQFTARIGALEAASFRVSVVEGVLDQLDAHIPELDQLVALYDAAREASERGEKVDWAAIHDQALKVLHGWGTGTTEADS